MTAPFEPVTICEEFVHQTLSVVAAVTDEFPGGIHPAFSPADVESRHCTHDFAGPDEGRSAVPFGQGIAALTLHWDITAWTPSPDRQELRAGMKAIQAELTGPSLRGKQFRFVSDDGSAWRIQCGYRGPIVVPADVGPPGIWQRVSGRYELWLNPAS